MRARRWAVIAVLLSVSGCGTSFLDSLTAAPPAPTAPPAGRCPADQPAPDRNAPDPDRPVVQLDFRLADDRRTVEGTETVTFTPDLPTARLVFRLAPNAPSTAAAGSGLTVTGIRGDDVAEGGYADAGAAAPGGLYVVELDHELAAGEQTEVRLAFTLALGSGGFDRVGAAETVSWWGSGAPLLAWEPGVGWAEDPFVEILGETTSSPVADTTIRVSAPAELTVLMTGSQAEPSAARDGRRTWSATEPVARDVSVAVGEFSTAEATTPDGVAIRVGVLPGRGPSAPELADWTTRSMAELQERFGAFPYATLTVAALPDYGGGIEYPSAILLAAPSQVVLLHEVAHMWFYGMVGDSQFRDPWLDEAFATYAEAVRRPPADGDVDGRLAVPGPVGSAMDEFADDDRYFSRVYGKGGAALLTARTASGTAEFDAALRCYVEVNAWTTATPADLARALAELPAALDVLVEAGALQPEDLPG